MGDEVGEPAGVDALALRVPLADARAEEHAGRDQDPEGLDRDLFEAQQVGRSADAEADHEGADRLLPPLRDDHGDEAGERDGPEQRRQRHVPGLELEPRNVEKGAHEAGAP